MPHKPPGAQRSPQPEFEALIRKANERFDAMTPGEQASMRAEQAIGYVIAELALGVFDNEPVDRRVRARAALKALAEIEKLLNKNSRARTKTFSLLAGHAGFLLPRARFRLKTSIARARADIAPILDQAAPDG